MEINERDEPVCDQMRCHGVEAFTSGIGCNCEQHEEAQRCCRRNEKRDDRADPHHTTIGPLSEFRRCRVIPETGCEATCKEEGVRERWACDRKCERVYRGACHDRLCQNVVDHPYRVFMGGFVR